MTLQKRDFVASVETSWFGVGPETAVRALRECPTSGDEAARYGAPGTRLPGQ
ncbi:MAG: hypothetical protein JSS95_09165 [Acidobacteria bacterium]|nr:hypothetical protein [Acidobacteriota bacterium]